MQHSLQTHAAISWEWDFSTSHSEWTSMCSFISFVLTAQEDLTTACIKGLCNEGYAAICTAYITLSQDSLTCQSPPHVGMAVAWLKDRAMECNHGLIEHQSIQLEIANLLLQNKKSCLVMWEGEKSVIPCTYEFTV